MKKFQVIKKIGDFAPKVVREFDDVLNAKSFCDLLKKSETYAFTKYYVTTICGED